MCRRRTRKQPSVKNRLVALLAALPLLAAPDSSFAAAKPPSNASIRAAAEGARPPAPPSLDPRVWTAFQRRLALLRGPGGRPGLLTGITVTPSSISLALDPGDSHTESKTLDIPSLGTVAVDIVFMVDSTGSMQGAIDQLKVQIEGIINRLTVDFANLQIGFVEFRDHDRQYDSNPVCAYNDTYSDPGNPCIQKMVKVSSDFTPGGPLRTAISSLLADGGGDVSECHSAVFQRLAEDPANAIGWRPGSQRLIVQLTDAPPHDCNFCSIRPGGCPHDVMPLPGVSGIDPGLDGVIDGAGTYPKDAPILATIDHLAAGGLHSPIRLVTIFARTFDINGFGPEYDDEIGTPYDPTMPPGVWRLLSQRSGGEAVAVAGDGLPPGGLDLADFVEQVIGTVTAKCDVISADTSDPAFRTWIETDGKPLPAVVASAVFPPATLNITVTITVPPGTAPGIYSFTLDFLCDGGLLGSQSITVDVSGSTSSDCDKLEVKLDKIETKLDVLEAKSDKLEAKSDKLETKSDKIETKLDVLESKDDKLETKIDVIHGNIDKLEAKSDKLEAKSDKLETKSDKIETKLDVLEAKSDKLEAKSDKIESKLDVLETKDDKLESKLDVVDSKVDKLETKSDKIETKLDRLETKDDKLESKLDALDSKVDKIETKLDKLETKLDQATEAFCEIIRLLLTPDGRRVSDTGMCGHGEWNRGLPMDPGKDPKKARERAQP